MNCQKCKTEISAYLDNELQPTEMREVMEHLSGCAECKKYADSLDLTWQIIGDLKDIEPEPGYVGRFWTEVSKRETWVEKILKPFKHGGLFPKLSPALVAGIAIVIVSVFAVRHYHALENETFQVAEINEEDIEMFENMEFAENMDEIDDLEFLEDFEIIESLEINGSEQT